MVSKHAHDLVISGRKMSGEPLTSHELQKRQREAEALAASEREGLEPFTLSSLLASCDLEHHTSALVDKTTIDELQSRLLANRPLFLEHIRNLGLTRLVAGRKRVATPTTIPEESVVCV